MYLHGRAFTHGTMDRPIELFLISANDPQSGCCMDYPVCLMVHNKISLAANQKE